VICLMNSQREVTDLGGTMRLGAFTAKLLPGRARARSTARGDQRAAPPPLRGEQRLPRAAHESGMRVSGTSPDGDLVEMIELPDHPWFLATRSSTRS
jgi:CTP synthase